MTTATTQGLAWEHERSEWKGGYGRETYRAGQGAVSMTVIRSTEWPDNAWWLEVRFDLDTTSGVQFDSGPLRFATAEEGRAAGERIAARLNRVLAAGAEHGGE